MKLFNITADFILIWGITSLILHIMTQQAIEEKQPWHLFAIINTAWLISATITFYKWKKS